MIQNLLQLQPTAIAYTALSEIHKRFPKSHILETREGDFDWRKFADANGYTYQTLPDPIVETMYSWQSKPEQIIVNPINSFSTIEWGGHTLQIFQITYEVFMQSVSTTWVVADSEEITRGFFTEVCRWNSISRDEIRIFQEGHWEKNKELFQSIQRTRLDSLILASNLKQAIVDDARKFFSSQERYRKFNVPWKRGVILIGPPGNGKTHMIQGLINELKLTCLYVKSLVACYNNEHASIRLVFDEARESAPCILVLEDIDTLIDERNRSFFLNEIDGFQKNEGIFTIATTNHPEKLDPAIVDRPSRFDRKYHFELPAISERIAYLKWWNTRLVPELRASESAIASVAETTAGFSFAYLKELALASCIARANG
jgi:DNA replication protein DnaC